MKLYRGIAAAEFLSFTPESAARLRSTWEKVLLRRARGDRSYPDALNGEILAAKALARLRRQYFTDDLRIARSYARSSGGLLLEIDVPPGDLLRHFTPEFQNFGRRKKKFEIVYMVDALMLSTKAKRWKLRTSSLSRLSPKAEPPR